MVVTIITNLLKFAGVKAFLSALRPVVVGLILGTAITIFVQVIFGVSNFLDSSISFDYKALIIFGVITTISLGYKRITKKVMSPILLIIIAALLGIIFYGLLT